MREGKPEEITKSTPAPWHVPVAVDDIAETGQHFELKADEQVRAALARIAGLRDLPRLEASFDLTPQASGGLRVTGRVSATVGQNCVVSLEPLDNEIDETVDLVFAPPASLPHQAEIAAKAPARNEAGDRRVEKRRDKPVDAPSDRLASEPESLIGGQVDLGALATEFLILGINPYPRKLDAVFQEPPDPKLEGRPFDALASLTKGRDGR
jgi:hypothetical protein